MVDESKNLDDVSSDNDDNEVSAATMNQQNVPWDQNSRPNSSQTYRQLLPHDDLLEEVHHQPLQPFPLYYSQHSTSDFTELISAPFASAPEPEHGQTQPTMFHPERRRLDEEKMERQPRAKRSRPSDPSISPPPSRYYDEETDFGLAYHHSVDDDAKENSTRPRQDDTVHYAMSEGDLYSQPPLPPYGYPSPPYPYSTRHRYHHNPPAQYSTYPSMGYPYGGAPPHSAPSPYLHSLEHGSVATGAAEWRASRAESNPRGSTAYYEGDSQSFASMPPPAPHPLAPPPRGDSYSPGITQHEEHPPPSASAHFAAHAGERTSQIPAGPTDAERREAGNNRAEQALEKWYSMLNELYKYKAEHGRVPQKYKDDKALGVWVNKQRMEFKPYLEDPLRDRTLIVAEKLRHLEDVGFEWAKPKGDQLWNEKYDELIQYKAQEGHCNVPTKYTRNPTLGRWRAQYKDFQEGNPTPMTQDRINKLNELGFVWSMMR